MKNIFLFALMIFSGQIFSQTSLSGKVVDGDGVGAVLANVAIYKGTDLVTSIQTDFDGFYNFSNLNAGTYNVETSYVGFLTLRIENVILYANEANNLDFAFPLDTGLFCGYFHEYKIPLIKHDQTTSGATFSAEQLRNFYHGSLFTKNR